MEALLSPAVLIKCPHCGNKFSPEESLEHEIRTRVEREFEERNRDTAARVRTEEERKFQTQIKRIEEDRRQKIQQLRSMEERMYVVDERERLLRDREEGLEIEMKKRLLDREAAIRQLAEKSAYERASLDHQQREQQWRREREQVELQARQRVVEETERAREEERMRAQELQKKLDDQAKLINEMKKRAEQGSMQMQGEVQELAIEDYLMRTFVRDRVEEISKGKRGGDCVHTVIDQVGTVCGRILYESKRTRHFGSDWVTKIKADMRLQQASVGVIVTESLPDGLTRFGEIDGVWICTFADFKSLAIILRSSLVRIGEVISAQNNRASKMDLVYTYVTSIEFKQKLEAAFESYRDMQDDLNREKVIFASQWAKREKRLVKAMESLASLYGDVRGIAGGAVQQIHGLELPPMDAIGDA